MGSQANKDSIRMQFPRELWDFILNYLPPGHPHSNTISIAIQKKYHLIDGGFVKPDHEHKLRSIPSTYQRLGLSDEPELAPITFNERCYRKWKADPDSIKIAKELEAVVQWKVKIGEASEVEKAWLNELAEEMILRLQEADNGE